MTYWVDEDRGSAFCLIDAPDETAVKKMHDKAHGLIPHEIVQVNSNVVEAFLGRMTDPEGYYNPTDPDLKIFNDPAFRIILVTTTEDIRLLKFQMGNEKANRLVKLYHEIVRKQLKEYEGSEVELKGEDFIASFISVTQAVNCAKAILKELHVAAEILKLRTSLNAGMPVSKHKELFGDTVKMAKYLCQIGDYGQVMLAAIIREIYKEDGVQTATKNTFRWLNPADENFLQLLMDTLSENWNNASFGVGEFCAQMSMSKSKLYRKSKQLLGMSPNELLREFRLTKSLVLLKTDRNITQTSFDCGFTSPSYFTKCFQQQFGLQPMSYIKDYS